jgi:hypothetical protein
MKILYYDCFSGISGDMNLGAMIDLGVEALYLDSELKKLQLKGWELLAEKDQRHGISGTKVTVKQTIHEHKHRHLADIEKIINDSGLSDKVRELTMKIFMKVADAEARVHGVPVSKVHFHEVGAIDSIIDICGAAICFSALAPDEVFVSPVELGGGMVRCDHGLLPVPAPATAEIIKGIRVKQAGLDFEATTPTGAAILSALGTRFDSYPPFRVIKTGYGIGQKNHKDVPNVLRVFLAEASEDGAGHDAVLIECNIDDMIPEFYEHLQEKLYEAGASDVFVTSVIMKRGRPGSKLSIITEKGREEMLKEILFTESTTIGIRTFPFRKDTLTRSLETVNTRYGKVRIKRSFLNEKEVSCKPEYNDIKKLAAELNLPLRIVYTNVLADLAGSR